MILIPQLIHLPGSVYINNNKEIIVNINRPSGFYSMLCHTGYTFFLHLMQANIKNNVDVSNFKFIFHDKGDSWLWYKDCETESLLNDIYNSVELKYINNQDIPKTGGWSPHSLYKNSYITEHAIAFNKCFTFTDVQTNIYLNLIQKYNINFEKTIGVYYRGTDKKIELTLADYYKYTSIVNELLIKNPDYKILIVSDQKQVINLFTKTFTEKCFYIEELPTTEGDIGIHRIKTLKNKSFSTKILTATVKILANCNLLVNCTGNMAAAIMMTRGHSKNTWLFDNHGNIQHDILTQ